MPLALSVLARFRKNDTVMGMMGQMQGISTASSPPTKPISRMYSSEWSAMLSVPVFMARNSLTTGCQRESCEVVSGES